MYIMNKWSNVKALYSTCRQQIEAIYNMCSSTFGSGTDPMSLVILLLFFFLGRRSSKSLRLRRFKSDQDEIWHDCSSRKCAPIDGVGVLIRCHTFKILTITSLQQQAAGGHCCICNSVLPPPRLASGLFTVPDPWYIRTCCFSVAFIVAC